MKTMLRLTLPAILAAAPVFGQSASQDNWTLDFTFAGGSSGGVVSGFQQLTPTYR